MSNDDLKTAAFEQPLWLAPVESRADLPTEHVEPGFLCFVEDEGAIYRFEDGGWLLEASRPK